MVNKIIKKSLRYLVTLFLIACLIGIFKSMVIDIYIVNGISMEPTLHNGEYVFVDKYSYNIKTPEYIPFLNIKIPFLTFKGLDKPKIGDIALFKLPVYRIGERIPSDVTIVKRIAGLPGDTMKLNYEKFKSKIIFTFNKKNYFKTNKILIRVPRQGDTITVADMNNQFIADLIRNEGNTFKVKADDTILIDGKPTKSYIVKKDYYFMRGDNKLNSSDSRNWGFLPKDKLIGKLLF
jgi:signal peptidase I